MTPAGFPNHPGAGYQSGSFFQPDYEWVNIPRRAVGYRYDKEMGSYKKFGSVDVSWRLPAACFISTVENLAQYCNGLMNREDVVSAKMKEDFLWKGSQLSDGTDKSRLYKTEWESETHWRRIGDASETHRRRIPTFWAF